MTIPGFAPLNSEHCVLHESRIDLWQFSLHHEVHKTSFILNEEEMARANRFHFDKHKRRFATARATMRIILSRYLNCAPEHLEFTYNKQGKPSVVNSQKIALLAVGKQFPVGVDVEHYSARPYEGIARTLFSPQECDDLSKAPRALKAALFFHIWSQKEAFIKVNGLGLSYPTQEFSVPTTVPTKQLVEDALHQTTWQLRSFMPQVACAGALCHHPTIREIRYGVMPQQPIPLEF